MLQKLPIERFSRLILVKEIGLVGLAKLRAARVLIVGCGATGSTAAELLVRLGVGFVRVVDKDFVDASNLPRVHLFDESDAEKSLPKAIVCAEKLKLIDSSARIEGIPTRVSAKNLEKLIQDVDVIIDGTDNWSTRLLINEASVRYNKPWLHMGVQTWFGQTMMINPSKGPCLRCLLYRPPEDAGNACETLGVVNTAVTMTVSVGVSLLLRHLLNIEPDYDHLYIVDSKNLVVEKVKIAKRGDCPVCMLHKFEKLHERARAVSRVCGSNAVEIEPQEPLDLDLARVAAALGSKVRVRTDYTVRINVCSEAIVVLFRDGRAIVEGLTDEVKAAEIFIKEVAEPLGVRDIYEKLLYEELAKAGSRPL